MFELRKTFHCSEKAELPVGSVAAWLESVLKSYFGHLAEGTSSLKGSINIAQGNALGFEVYKTHSAESAIQLGANN